MTTTFGGDPGSPPVAGEEPVAGDGVKPSALFAELASIVNHEDVATILNTQAEIHQRFKESNESLITFNDFSATTYNHLSTEYDKHTRAVKEMKKDLDNVFKRIRQLQSMLKQKYPEAFMGN